MGHELVWLGGTRVLDWVPATGDYRLFECIVDAANGSDPLPGPARLHKTFQPKGIGTGHRLTYLDGNRVLDFEPLVNGFRTWRMSSGA